MGRLTTATAFAAALVSAAGATTGGQPQASELAAGERAYAKCLACHALAPQGDDRDGPTLHMIVGRKVAGLETYAYSPALRAYGERQPRWTHEALDAFLADPQAVAPGNTMGFFGLRKAEERSALIAWLATGPSAARR